SPLIDRPASTALITDFDGTLAHLIADPAAVQPLAGVGSVLNELAGRFGRVAVVSGRPVAFLTERLGVAPDVAVIGLYGFERSGKGGEVISEPGVDRWRPIVDHVVERLRSAVPRGAMVEPKGLAVTVHWRSNPAVADDAMATAVREARTAGLVTHGGRMSIELRPPLPVDKGTVVGALIQGYGAACFMGDDVGDLPAFAALDRASAGQGTATVKIAAVDDQSSPDVVAAADVAVDGPEGALDVFTWLAGSHA
ncbi:MAG: trehalose-phosphatase, partial [Acidimicrobiales bacterium]